MAAIALSDKLHQTIINQTVLLIGIAPCSYGTNTDTFANKIIYNWMATIACLVIMESDFY